MRGAGEHELKATLVSLAPARTCSSTGQLQRSSIWNLRHRPRFATRFTSETLQPTIDNPRAVPQHERLARTPQVRRCAREDMPQSTRPVKIPTDARLTAQFTPAWRAHQSGTAQPRNWASGGKVSARTRLTPPLFNCDGL